MKRHCFTVIELVIMCAVVTTLLSMILSATTTSKELAVKATCMSNLDQIRNVTELYRKDNGKLPYSEIWLTDFSYAGNYLAGENLNVFRCPGSQDADITNVSQLVSQTSYYYVPTYAQLQEHLEDGIDVGVSEEHLSVLAATQDGAIYDKSPDHHKGINIAYLFKEDDPDSDLQGTITHIDDPEDLLVMSGDGFVELPDIGDVGDNPDSPEQDEDYDPIVEDEEEPVAEFETTDEGTIELESDVTIKYEVLGAAISYGGRYDMAVTARFNFSGANASETVDPFGVYSDPVGSNLNSGNSASANPVSYSAEKVYPAGTEVSILAKSWKKTRTSKSGNKIKHWKKYMEVNSTYINGSASLSNVIMLVNGQDVPQIDGFLDQDNIVTFLGGYVAGGKINIGDDQVLVLFELGTTNLSSSAADFQDLVVLMTMFPAE